MRRADRLFQIVQFLRGGRLVTAHQLAQRLEVSKRTIYRDIADLIGSGVPINGEAGVGYMLESGYDVPPLMFSTDEIVALVAGVRLIRAWGGQNMSLAAQEALIKIESVLPKGKQDRFHGVGVHAIADAYLDDATRYRLDQLENAEHARRRLEIDYRDQAHNVTKRVVRPLGLWFWGKVWTLIAWCELRDDFRMFRVDRISSVRALDHFREERDKSLKAFYLADTYSCKTPES